MEMSEADICLWYWNVKNNYFICLTTWHINLYVWLTHTFKVKYVKVFFPLISSIQRQSKHSQKSIQAGFTILLALSNTYSPVSSRWGINHVYTGGSAEDLAVADGMRDVDVPIDTAFNKLHVILSQSARLISKHILHLGGKEEREEDKGTSANCLEADTVCKCACVCVCVHAHVPVPALHSGRRCWPERPLRALRRTCPRPRWWNRSQGISASPPSRT